MLKLTTREMPFNLQQAHFLTVQIGTAQIDWEKVWESGTSKWCLWDGKQISFCGRSIWQHLSTMEA